MSTTFEHYDAAGARGLRDTVEDVYRRSYVDAIASGDPFDSPDRRGDALVAEMPLNDVRGSAGAQYPGRAGVPQIVNARTLAVERVAGISGWCRQRRH